MMVRHFFISIPLSMVLLGACGVPDPVPEEITESRSGITTSQTGESDTETQNAMIAAANPLAVEAGLEIIKAGGDAVDAAIAVQAVLGLVEPQSSGIGGGAFMLRLDGETGEIRVYDGRETAPASADETLFLDEAGSPSPYIEAWQSGRSTGVPGVIAMLAMAHDDHGELPWTDAFQPGIALAREGFDISPRMAYFIQRVQPMTRLDEHARSASYFYTEDGAPKPVGTRLVNNAYADTLQTVSEDWRNFYTGEIAAGIVEVAGEEPVAGSLTLEDMASYEALEREALCLPYRNYQLCSAPPPSSGGVTTAAILTLLEGFEMSNYGPESIEGWHLFIEASRLAYADRDEYVADPDFADVPVSGLTDLDYLAERAALISPDSVIETAQPGLPPGADDQAEDTSVDSPGTSHFVIVDSDGDVVSMTTTVESPFGNARLTQGGFLTNNQLTDFAFDPRDAQGRLRANAAAAGKRPRSSMSPIIVLDENGEFVMATGSPGGSSIIAYTAKTLVGVLDWGLTPQQAANLPNIVARGDTVRVEAGLDPAIIEGLRAMGHTLSDPRGEDSGIHIVQRLDDGSLVGGADPRREGIAAQP